MDKADYGEWNPRWGERLGQPPDKVDRADSQLGSASCYYTENQDPQSDFCHKEKGQLENNCVQWEMAQLHITKN